jgi:flagellar hook-associated protein 2
VNNVSVTSSTNTVDSAVPGATLTLLKQGPDAIRVDVARNSADAAASVKTFVDAYNDLLSFYADQRTAAAAGKANIARDPLVLGLQGSLRSALSAEHLGGTYTRLAAVGLGFSATGKVTLDADVFSAAIASHPADVQKLFAGAAGGGGAFGALDTLIDTYTQSGGLVSDARTRITAQVASISHRLDNMQARLDVRRLALQREYTATDLAMTQMNNAVSSLSSLNNQYRLF